MRLPLTTCVLLFLGLWLGLSASAQPNVTPYARMTAQLEADAAHSPLVRVISLGKSAKGGCDLWLVRLASPAADSTQTIRVLVLCRQHGDEPASTEAVLGLVHRVATGGDPALRAALAHVTLYLVPMVNPDGAEADTRGNGAGADLNRDWGVFHQPETRAVADAARLIRPNLVIDAHNWDGDDEYNADCVEVPREAATGLGKASHGLQQRAVRDLAACGYPIHPTAWGVDSDPRLAHRWFARRHILSALVETHSGSPADIADFQSRQGMYAALIHGIVRHYAATYAAEKPRLDTLEGDVPGDIREAALFSPPVKTAARPFFPHGRGRSLVWLWAIGAYALALWGVRRGTHPATPPISLSRFPSRNGKGGGRINGRFRLLEGTFWGRASLRCASLQRTSLQRATLTESPSKSQQNRLITLSASLSASGRVPRNEAGGISYYSYPKRRAGTDTKARSGQRRAVSSPSR